LKNKKWNGKLNYNFYTNSVSKEFEGEILNRKYLTGKVKQYKYNSKLIFEGEYLKGKKWNGKILFNDIYRNN